MNIEEVEKWLKTSNRKDRIVYFVGDLAKDRVKDKTVDEIASLIWKQYLSGIVTLIQRKSGLDYGKANIVH